MTDFINTDWISSRLLVNNDALYFLPSDYRISLKYSKLIPYYAWRIFNYGVINKDKFIYLPTINHTLQRFPTAGINNVLSIININENISGTYVNVKINNTFLPIFVKSHLIYTYNVTNLEELLTADPNIKPTILMVLCNSRDQELHKDFNIDTAVLLVNSDPDIQYLMRPFIKYIKIYKEAGVKNVLYTQNPNHYIFDNLIEKTKLMNQVKLKEYIDQFLPTNVDIADTTTMSYPQEF